MTDETLHVKHRKMNGSRALDYRKDGKRMQRCSRCHTEHDMSRPNIYDVDGKLRSPELTMAPLMVGQDLLGFICRGCFYATVRHIVSLFPDGFGFPFVDDRGRLLPPSRCEDCGTALRYSDDGLNVLCSQCDGQAVGAEAAAAMLGETP